MGSLKLHVCQTTQIGRKLHSIHSVDISCVSHFLHIQLVIILKLMDDLNNSPFAGLWLILGTDILNQHMLYHGRQSSTYIYVHLNQLSITDFSHSFVK